MSAVKDTNNKTLTQFICSLIKKEDETFEGLKKLIPNVIEASKISYNETNGLINKTKKELKEGVNNLNKLSMNLDTFYDKSNKFFNLAQDQISKIESDLKDNVTKVQQIILFYGYSITEEKYKNPEKFFELISEFANDIDKAMPKDEPKKVFNRKHEVGKKIVEQAKIPGMENIFKEMKMKQMEKI